MPPIIYIEETDSTNSYLKSLLLSQEPEEGTIFATHHQRAGRGQRGSSWESQRGKNLTFSMLLYPAFLPIDQQFILSQLVSFAINQVLSEYTSDITIKWPNDIYWKNKKIAGILIENILSENKLAQSIIGIGININQEQFISNAPNPVSLMQIGGEKYALEEILKNIQEKILCHYSKLKNEESQTIVNQYKNKLYRKAGYHLYNDGENNFFAQIKGVNLTGHLILEKENGEIKEYAFKEVKYIL